VGRLIFGYARPPPACIGSKIEQEYSRYYFRLFLRILEEHNIKFLTLLVQVFDFGAYSETAGSSATMGTLGLRPRKHGPALAIASPGAGSGQRVQARSWPERDDYLASIFPWPSQRWVNQRRVDKSQAISMIKIAVYSVCRTDGPAAMDFTAIIDCSATTGSKCLQRNQLCHFGTDSAVASAYNTKPRA